ncbi:ADP-ribosylation factor family protein [Cardiosporidium cionae]|uniref:ADP-ribosylation factor family protein n=1 Tax=Cardiosporidium cionae TaxID=476202 RepID=A0ABQ7JDW6_9APIC|nr:ADP-ribosylation factor family protein [Cardiosporidium cionae]|eukprot:KAF8822216.1 ADP-ribosylation factor family protein [Cardiosporidium cionae]
MTRTCTLKEMGQCSSTLGDIVSLCSMKKSYQIRVEGPAQAGKTSIIKRLKYGRFMKMCPTQRVQAERVDFRGCVLILWDVRKQYDEVASRENFDVCALIYVVDSANYGRSGVAARSFRSILLELPNVSIVLVLATKQDKAKVMSVSEVQSLLILPELSGKSWSVKVANLF